VLAAFKVKELENRAKVKLAGGRGDNIAEEQRKNSVRRGGVDRVSQVRLDDLRPHRPWLAGDDPEWAPEQGRDGQIFGVCRSKTGF
jgi:hypothetical protein